MNKNEIFADGSGMVYFPSMSNPNETEGEELRKFIAENSSEHSIARRLAFARRVLRLSQREIAEKIGVSRERLASYEYGRAPLKFDVGIRFCKAYNINEGWLASGALDMHPYLGVCAKKQMEKAPLGALFSEILGGFNKDQISDAYSKKIDKTAGRFCFDSPQDYKSANDFLRFLSESWIHQIPNYLKGDFVNHVHQAAQDFINKNDIPYTPMPIEMMLEIRSRINDKKKDTP